MPGITAEYQPEPLERVKGLGETCTEDAVQTGWLVWFHSHFAFRTSHLPFCTSSELNPAARMLQ